MFGVVSGLNTPVTMNTGPIVATVAIEFGYNLNALDENVTFDITIGRAAGIAMGNNSVVQATRRRSTMRFLISTSRSIRWTPALPTY